MAYGRLKWLEHACGLPGGLQQVQGYRLHLLTQQLQSSLKKWGRYATVWKLMALAKQ